MACPDATDAVPGSQPSDFCDRLTGGFPSARTDACDLKRTSLMSEQNPSWIADWNPEDEKFWESKGKFIARRNLIWSIVAEHIGFSVWAIWSIVATKLPAAATGPSSPPRCCSSRQFVWPISSVIPKRRSG